MRLLNLSIGRSVARSPRRSAKAFRPRLQPYLEGLEERTVLSGGAGAASVAAAAVAAPVSITGIHVTNLAVTGAQSLLATVNVTGTLNAVSGAIPFTLPGIQLPITATASTTTTAGAITPAAATTTGTPVLDLSLEIPNLDLLGLHVVLDNDSGGPVTIDLTAIPGGQPGGGLLGSLLSDLSGPGGLLNLGSQTGTLTSGLTTILNGVLTDLTTGGASGTGGTVGTAGTGTDTVPANAAEIVDLTLGPIDADILGLDVTTSVIYLNVYAVPGGGLLGNLLSGLDNLLDNPAASGLLGTLVTGVSKDLGSLGL